MGYGCTVEGFIGMGRTAFHDLLWFPAASSMYPISLTMGTSTLRSSYLTRFYILSNPPKKMSAIALLISLHRISMGVCCGMRGSRNRRTTSSPILSMYLSVALLMCTRCCPLSQRSCRTAAGCAPRARLRSPCLSFHATVCPACPSQSAYDLGAPLGVVSLDGVHFSSGLYAAPECWRVDKAGHTQAQHLVAGPVARRHLLDCPFHVCLLLPFSSRVVRHEPGFSNGKAHPVRQSEDPVDSVFDAKSAPDASNDHLICARLPQKAALSRAFAEIFLECPPLLLGQAARPAGTLTVVPAVKVPLQPQ